MAPPIAFANPNGGDGANFATWNAGGGSMSIVTPASAKPGDLLVLAIGLRAGAPAVVFSLDGDFGATLAGWTVVQVVTTANNRLYLCTRRMGADDIGTHVATFTGGTNGQAALIAIRGAQSVPATGAGTDVVASTSFVCPSQTLATFAGALLNIIVSDVVAATIAGANNNFQATDGTVGIEATLSRPEVAGATGTRTGTTGSNRSGIAASFQLLPDPIPSVDVGKLSISLSPVGAIGLPAVGI